MARILVIDDDPLVRSSLRIMLEAENHEVVDLENGRKSLPFQREQNFDLVITDIIMPEKEGVATIMELKQEFPDLPIVAISGGGRGWPEGYLDTAMSLGADAALAKPFEPDTLIDCIDGLLQKES